MNRKQTGDNSGKTLGITASKIRMDKTNDKYLDKNSRNQPRKESGGEGLGIGRRMAGDKKLTDKQKLFADYYLGKARFNATKAAKMAGYSEKTAYEIGSQNLRKLEIQGYIDTHLRQMTLGANEVLSRLTDIANGSIEDVLDEEGKFDYHSAKQLGKLPLLKKLKRKSTSKKVDVQEDGEESTLETSLLVEEVEFEMYSAHEALRDLGKYHKLFVERHEVEGKVGTYTMSKEEWEKEAEQRLKKLNGRLKETA